jgi:hypothetical protein|tara:strand:- start:246 stop:761 length:516 start_codon:yes stop_codon:yes gene_type:complete
MIDFGREVVPYDDIKTLGDVEDALLIYTSTMSRHELMYKKAELNPLKGEMDGHCNVTQCQKPHAIMWNNGTDAWYCESCANDINNSCRYSDFWPLCVPKQTRLDEVSGRDVLYVGHEDQLPPIKDINNFYDFNFTSSKPKVPYKREMAKISRNAPCPCGRGLKYKKCCGRT